MIWNIITAILKAGEMEVCGKPERYFITENKKYSYIEENEIFLNPKECLYFYEMCLNHV